MLVQTVVDFQSKPNILMQQMNGIFILHWLQDKSSLMTSSPSGACEGQASITGSASEGVSPCR